jgi:light-regulated signal transduction histidine kinase (bacteriophytochrome)
VRERTHELEVQNEKLTEYDFINSHLLRAPLARILGLADLLCLENTSVSDRELIESLNH